MGDCIEVGKPTPVANTCLSWLRSAACREPAVSAPLMATASGAMVGLIDCCSEYFVDSAYLRRMVTPKESGVGKEQKPGAGRLTNPAYVSNIENLSAK